MKGRCQSIQELTYNDIQQNGIDITIIRVCKEIRQLAKLDRISLDEAEHRNRLSKHLYDYIEYYSLDMLAFIKQYLSNLQPYMIERKTDQKKIKSFYCVIDNLYRVSVYVKADATQHEEVIVSFHEDNQCGTAKSNELIKYHLQKYVPIFAESVLDRVPDKNKYFVSALFQKGLAVLPLELSAAKCQDVFIVEKKSINLQFVSYCNEYIRDLYTSDLQLDFDKIEAFSMLQQIPFTAYGRDTFSSISILIDSLNVQTDCISKSVADCALIIFVQNLKLTIEQQNEIKELLDKKYMSSDIRKIDLILDRVKANLALNYNMEMNTLATEVRDVYVDSPDSLPD